MLELEIVFQKIHKFNHIYAKIFIFINNEK